MPTDAIILESLDIFSDFTPKEIEKINALVHHQRLMEGEVLICRGDHAKTFYVMIVGNFMVHFKEGTAFTLHNRGDIMGWSSILAPFQYNGTAVALTEGEVLAIEGSELLELIQSDSVIGDKLMKKINPIVGERSLHFTKEACEETEAV